MLNVMLQIFNKFLIKGVDIYFGRKDKVYVINKQLIVDVFGVCVEGYVEDLKGHVNKSLVVHALQGYRLAHANSSIDQWNAKSLGLPYFVRYHAVISVIYQREKVQYFSNKDVIALVRAKKGRSSIRHILYSIVYVVNWIGGISMLRRIRGIRKIPINLPWYWQKSFSISLCIKRTIHRNHLPRLKELGRRCRQHQRIERKLQ